VAGQNVKLPFEFPEFLRDERILSIDPGYAKFGYCMLRTGIIEELGVIRFSGKKHANDTIACRLEKIHNNVQNLIKKFQPTIVVVEQPIYIGNKDLKHHLIIKLHWAFGVIIGTILSNGIVPELASVQKWTASNPKWRRSKKHKIDMQAELYAMTGYMFPTDATDAFWMAMWWIGEQEKKMAAQLWEAYHKGG